MTSTNRLLVGLWIMGLSVFAGAQAPAAAPVGANGICKDGTYSTAAERSGACRGHKGVQTWYDAGLPSLPVPTVETTMQTMPAPTTSGSVASMPGSEVQTGKRPGPAQAAAARTAAPGGGPGLVWVNTASNVYHCNGDAFYGKTKDGAYMSEADAKAKDAHGVRGKTCGGA